MADAAASQPVPARSRERRAYLTALLLIGLGGAALLVGYGLVWASAGVPLIAGSDGPATVREFTGRELYPVAAASGWVCLAGLAGILATRSWGRQLVALLVLLAAAGGAVAGIAFAASPSSSAEAAVRALTGGPALGAVSATPWWLLAVVGGLVAVVGAAWTLARGRRWPAMGARYERRAKDRAAISPWEAQDLGQDPTDDLVE